MPCMCGATDCPSCGRAQGYTVRFSPTRGYYNPETLYYVMSVVDGKEQYLSENGEPTNRVVKRALFETYEEAEEFAESLNLDNYEVYATEEDEE